MAVVDINTFLGVTLNDVVPAITWIGAGGPEGLLVGNEFSTRSIGGIIEVTGSPDVTLIPFGAVITAVEARINATGTNAEAGGIGAFVQTSASTVYSPPLSFGFGPGGPPPIDGIGDRAFDGTLLSTITTRAALAALVVGWRLLGGTGGPTPPTLITHVVNSYFLRVTFDPPPPPVVNPQIGLTQGKTLVTILGAGFDPAAKVNFDTVDNEDATEVVVVDSGTITCRTPAHAAGIVNVVITNPDGDFLLLADSFEFIAPKVTPDNGPFTGGTPVTITGADYVDGSRIFFGLEEATEVLFQLTGGSPQLPFFTCLTPRQDRGPVAVVIVEPE